MQKKLSKLVNIKVLKKRKVGKRNAVLIIIQIQLTEEKIF